jgi:hypothetical protein
MAKICLFNWDNKKERFIISPSETKNKSQLLISILDYPNSEFSNEFSNIPGLQEAVKSVQCIPLAKKRVGYKLLKQGAN